MVPHYTRQMSPIAVHPERPPSSEKPFRPSLQSLPFPGCDGGSDCGEPSSHSVGDAVSRLAFSSSEIRNRPRQLRSYLRDRVPGQFEQHQRPTVEHELGYFGVREQTTHVSSKGTRIDSAAHTDLLGPVGGFRPLFHPYTFQPCLQTLVTRSTRLMLLPPAFDRARWAEGTIRDSSHVR